jgi:hypothetical protein
MWADMICHIEADVPKQMWSAHFVLPTCSLEFKGFESLKDSEATGSKEPSSQIAAQSQH